MHPVSHLFSWKTIIRAPAEQPSQAPPPRTDAERPQGPTRDSEPDPLNSPPDHWSGPGDASSPLPSHLQVPGDCPSTDAPWDNSEHSAGAGVSSSAPAALQPPDHDEKHFPLYPQGRCAHTEHWKYIRGKRGFAYYVCHQCELKWCQERSKGPRKPSDPNATSKR